MKLLLVSDTFYPIENSGSLQLQDLVENISKKIDIYVFTVGKKNKVINSKSIKTIYCKVLFFRKKNYFLRFFSEFLYSIQFFFQINKYAKNNKINFDGIIFYSPSIFFGPLIYILKRRYNIKSFLILRDIFPNWAIDLKILKNFFLIKFFTYFANLQYKNADIIGVQTNSLIDNNNSWINKNYKSKLFLFHNWLTPKKIIKSSNFSFQDKKKYFIYAGNIGVAQDIELIINAFSNIADRNFKLVLIGSGVYFSKIKSNFPKTVYSNIEIYNSIEDKYLAYLVRNAYAGVLSLNHKHKLDNIPGKLLTYLSNNIPVIGSLNKANDLISLNERYRFGLLDDSNSVNNLTKLFDELIDNKILYNELRKNTKMVFNKFYKTSIASNKY